MATPLSRDDFLTLVRKSGLIEPQRLDPYLKQLQDNGSLPADAKRLAGLLVREGLLTYFQSEQLLLGKTRGFTLGNYRVLERLGTGGMGNVYLCEHTVMHRRVAVKVLPADRAEDPSYLERFQREAQAAAALDHPNIVRAHDVAREGRLHYLVMEYIHGPSLQEVIHKYGPMDYRTAAHYVRQAAVGLQHAHEAGLVHRDIKPSNLLVDRSGTVKILDMGLALFADARSPNLTDKLDRRSVLGTADYMAPEQAQDSHSVDIRADLYSLGATFYYLLTGNPPFTGTMAQRIIAHQVRPPKPVRELRPEVPAELAAVLDKMLAKEPADRYQMPAEVVEALEPWTRMPAPLPPEMNIHRLSRAAQEAGSFVGQITAQPPAPPAAASLAKARKAPTARETGDASGAAVETAVAVAGKASTRTNRAAPTTAPRAAKPVKKVADPRRRLALWVATAALALVVGGVGVAFLAGAFDARPPAPPGPSQPPDKDAVVELPKKDPVVVPPNKDAAPKLPDGPARLLVSPAGEGLVFPTVAAALRVARPGDRIVVLLGEVRENLRLPDGTATGKGVTIEGNALSGKPVVWSASDGAEASKPLLEAADAAGLRLKGFVLDGKEAVDDLIVLAGRCPDLALEDIHLRGFRRSAVKLTNCQGEDVRPVTLTRLRTTTAAVDNDQAPQAALLFEAAADQVNQNIQVQDSRFEGPCQAAAVFAGPAADVAFQRNRIYKVADGIRVKKTTPPAPLRLGVVSNTFYDLDKGLHWDGLPAAAAPHQVVVQNNLFLRTRKLGFVDDLAWEPAVTPAMWIWFDEAPKGGFPAESRYFRKTFKVADPAVRQATLDVAGDDSFVVWLNGVPVGQSPHAGFTARVHSFDVTDFLQPGKANVLAVQATNAADPMTGRLTDAGLLVQLTYTTAGAKAPEVVVSDKTWKAARSGPDGWQKPSFNDSAWQPAREQEAYNGQKFAARHNLVWDSVVQKHLPPQGSPIRLLAAGNYRDESSAEGYPVLDPYASTVLAHTNPDRPFPTDSSDDATFLRYPDNHFLARVGRDRIAVGVPPPGPAASEGPVAVLRSGASETPFPSVREALLKARRGDRVSVHRPILEERLMLTTKDQLPDGVVLEGDGSSGRPVLWRLPAGAPAGQPLLSVSGVAGLSVRGFLLDGQDRLHDLVHLEGRCPGLTLEDLHLKGFRRSAVQLSNGSGEPTRPILLQDLRITTLVGSPAAVVLGAGPGQTSQHVQVRDSRFEGPYQAILQIGGPVVGLLCQGNRFYQADTGVRFRKSDPLRLDLTLLSNTFYGLEKVLHFESAPAGEPDSRLVLQKNLFARTPVLVHVDGLELSALPEGLKPLIKAPAGNVVCGGEPKPEHALLGVSKIGTPAMLCTDAAEEIRFLRYSRDDLLAQAGSNRSPVGLPPVRITLLTPTKPPEEFFTLAEALKRARPGGRILVEMEVLREQLIVSGESGLGQGVTVEGKAPSGKPVLWRPPAGLKSEQALLALTQVENFQLKGFVLDGLGRVDHAVAVAGRCPDLILEDLHLHGFRRAGVKLAACAGLAKRLVFLRRLRISAAGEAEAALRFVPGTVGGPEATQFVRIHDSRFEGPYQAAIEVAGPVANVEVSRNRIYQARDGLLYRKADPLHRVQMTVTSNTFCELQVGLHFETMPTTGENSRITLTSNLFAKTTKSAQVDDFKPDPAAVAAQWIWFNEDNPLTAAPPESRFFRKAFDLPAMPLKKAILEIAGDENYVAWVNGTQVNEEDRTRTFVRRVVAIDVAPHLRPGKNVVAVEGVNLLNPTTKRPTPAGVLVQLTCTPESGEVVRILSDRTWKVAKEAPDGWLKADFVDSGWTDVKVLGPYGKTRPPWDILVWDTVVQERYPPSGPQPIPVLAGSSGCERGTRFGYPILNIPVRDFAALPTDPSNDAEFLRYPKTSPLNEVGPKKLPLGVPPPPE
jgi:tRNA A-37 threonylcarbamoyl transferase component Bud32